MKTILFLAVLFFAAQSSPLHEIYRSFIVNLPMNASVQNQFLRSGYECLSNFEGVIINLVGSLQKDIPAKNYFDILRNLLVADDALEHKIAPQCLNVFLELTRYFNQTGVVIPEPYYWNYCNTSSMNFSSWEEEVKFRNKCWNVYERDLDIYYAERNVKHTKVFETYAHIVQDILRQNVTSIGANIAYVAKLMNNIVKPNTYLVHNNSQNVPFNQQRFIFEFMPALLEELGLSGNKNQTLLCLVDLFNTTMTALSNPNLYRGDSFTATHAFLEGAMHITDSIQRCSQHLDLSGASRLVYLLTHYPGKALLKVYSNEFLNFADFLASEKNTRMLLNNGLYSEAGKEYARHIKIALQDLVF